MEWLQWTTSDGLRLQGRHWQAHNPVAVIALVHGLGEHSGRYEGFADFFNRHHVAVVAIDQRGHGLSEGRRGHAARYGLLLEAVDLLLQSTRALYPEAPVFLYGHSFGGNQVLNYAVRYHPHIAGVVASGSWLLLRAKPTVMWAYLTKAKSYLFPRWSTPNRIEAQFISHDPDVVAAYCADPLVHDRITARMAVATQAAALYVYRHAAACQVPVLLMHGSDDPITDPRGSQLLADRIGTMATYHSWPGMYHEVHHETNRMEVLTYVWQWMSARLEQE